MSDIQPDPSVSTTLKRVCGWCHADLGGSTDPAALVTTGICAICEERMEEPFQSEAVRMRNALIRIHNLTPGASVDEAKKLAREALKG